jgi:hypothetical protein
MQSFGQIAPPAMAEYVPAVQSPAKFAEEQTMAAAMSRKTVLNMLLVIASALLAIALFIAGTIWRGRVAH